MRQIAAIDRNRLAGNIRSRVRSKKGDHARNLVRLAPAAQRCAARKISSKVGILDHRAVGVGCKKAGRDRINSNPARPQFRRKRAGERVQPALRRGISCIPCPRDGTGYRGNIDDPPAIRHMRRNKPHKVHRRHKVNLQQVAHRLPVELVQRITVPHPRIIDQNIQPRAVTGEALNQCVNRRRHALRNAKVKHHAVHKRITLRIPQRRNRGIQLPLLAPMQNDPHARSRQPPCDFKAKASGSARDEGGFFGGGTWERGHGCAIRLTGQ